MIAFASLFLGLVLGERPVELVVGDGVAAVELRLDGAKVGELREAPWGLDCDFGSDLAPRHLEAVALDSAGRELGRVAQWLNLPQPRAVLTAVLEPAEPGKNRVARLSWESAAGAEPKSVDASLDGQPLVVSDPRRIELPVQAGGDTLHLLQVEMRFEGWVTSRVDLTFGGSYADQVNTEMTALAIQEPKQGRQRKSALTVGEVEGWFAKNGEPLRVLAVEKGLAEIVVVLDRQFSRFVGPGERYKPPKALRLEDDQRFRFVSSTPKSSQGVASNFELFPISPAYDDGVGDLYQLLTGMSRASQDRPPRRNAAVAVAGLAAYESRRRRAVVLVPGQDQEEAKLGVEQVRRYLEHLRIPFRVWDPEPKPSEELGEWGEVRSVSSLEKLADAFEELEGEMERQWVVWIDGKHLPQQLELTPAAAGWSFVQ